MICTHARFIDRLYQLDLDALTDSNYALHPHLILGYDPLHIQSQYPFVSFGHFFT